ncbi:hypothetical protein [Idiomarina sp.]|uniref:hypothetical protein n=1 Tax=Idiomarina sp. TaxID=1874361 RepID=UPI002582EC56|nr:hypothetical protein [Idiomarina sp.]
MAMQQATGFFNGFNFNNVLDSFSNTANEYFKFRAAEKNAEATGAVYDELVNGSVEQMQNVNAGQGGQTSGNGGGFQLDQKTMLIGGGVLVALVLLMKR